MQEIYITASEIGEHLDISYRTIENWGRARKIEQDENGHYGLISCYNHKIEDYKTQIERYKQQLEVLKQNSPVAAKNKLRNQKLEAEVRKENAIADIKELERDQLKGMLVNADDVLIKWSEYIAKSKAKLLAIPNKLALELSAIDNPEIIQAKLTQVIDEALEELSSDLDS